MPILLVILPLWLVVSGVFAMWYYFHLERADALFEQARFATTVSQPLLGDDLDEQPRDVGDGEPQGEPGERTDGEDECHVGGHARCSSSSSISSSHRSSPRYWAIL
jgi:hypothetical protein